MRSAAGRAFLAVMLFWAMPAPVGAGPRTDYMLHCQGCHGPRGEGAPGGVPAFPGQLAKFLQAPGGREFLVRVPGVSQSELDDARVAALLNWLLATFDAAGLPPAFAPYTAAEVTATRRPPLTDVSDTRRRLLAAIDAASPTNADQASSPSRRSWAR